MEETLVPDVVWSCEGEHANRRPVPSASSRERFLRELTHPCLFPRGVRAPGSSADLDEMSFSIARSPAARAVDSHASVRTGTGGQLPRRRRIECSRTYSP